MKKRVLFVELENREKENSLYEEYVYFFSLNEAIYTTYKSGILIEDNTK